MHCDPVNSLAQKCKTPAWCTPGALGGAWDGAQAIVDRDEGQQEHQHTATNRQHDGHGVERCSQPDRRTGCLGLGVSCRGWTWLKSFRIAKLALILPCRRFKARHKWWWLRQALLPSWRRGGRFRRMPAFCQRDQDLRFCTSASWPDSGFRKSCCSAARWCRGETRQSAGSGPAPWRCRPRPSWPGRTACHPRATSWALGGSRSVTLSSPTAVHLQVQAPGPRARSIPPSAGFKLGGGDGHAGSPCFCSSASKPAFCNAC
jgi:hypothetical protein